MRFHVLFLWIGAISLCCVAPVAAQDADQDDPQELPDIAPHEIEIRGQLEISFPALERQPLVGFNPPPRVPAVPDDRQPFIEEYRQDPDARRQRLPDRYALPQFADRPDPNVGELEAQVGRYFSRIGRARFDVPVTERQRLSFDLDYEGQDRYTPFQDTTFAPHDVFDGHVSLSSSHGTVTLGADVEGQLDRFSLHDPFAADMGDVVDSRFRMREHYGGRVIPWLRFDGSVPASLQGFYGESLFNRPEEPRAADQSRERTYGFGASIEPGIGNRRITLEASTFFADQFEDETPGSSLGLIETGLSAPIIQNRQFELHAGVKGFAAGEEEGGLHQDAFDYYASPIVEVRWQPSATVSFYGQNMPVAQINSWTGLFRTNPYLQSAVRSSPSVQTINAESGMTLHLEPVQINVFGGYQYAPNHRYFEEADESVDFTSTITTSYGPATFARVGGDISLHVGDGFHASIGGSYQESRLDDLNQAVPYEAPFEGHGMLSWRIADQSLIQLTMEYLGPRPISTYFDETINPYLSMNLRGVYDFTPNIGIIVEAKNVGPESMLERWNYHPNPPLMVTTGLRVRL